jgi:SMI1/KNR4 family protein SUKH-1
MAFAGSEELVAAAEAVLGRRLPDAHRQRLIRDNGGEIEASGDRWTLYPVRDDTDRRTVARTANHIVRENEAHRRDWPDALPPGWVGIADNGTGDLLVVGPDRDDVCFWDHETGGLEPVSVAWD